MTDGINIGEAIQKIAEQAAENQAPQKPEAPQGDDVSRFESAMNSGGDPQLVTEAGSPGDANKVSGPGESQDLGDAILNGMEKAKESHTTKVDSINRLLEKSGAEPLSVQDTMKLQFELMQLNLQQEVTTKTADKSSQGVQTLFKNQ